MPQVGSISIIGTDHLENKENNQDSISCDDLGHCQLIIAADGAGSAKKSYIGSQKLVTRLNASLKKLTKSQLKFPVQNKNTIEKKIINTIEDLRKDLLAHAKDNSILIEEIKEQESIFSKLKKTISSV